MARPDITIAALMSSPRIAWTDAFVPIVTCLSHFQIPLWRAGGAWWHHGMDVLFAKAVEHGVDIVWTLDYDSVATIPQMVRMFRYMQKRPDIDALCPMQVGFSGDLLVGIEGERRSLSAETLPVQVDMAHFGCTLIRVKAIAATPRPWFREVPDSQGGWDGDDKVDADAAFWRAFKAAGQRVYVAPDVRVGHLGVMVKSVERDGAYTVSTVGQWLGQQLQEYVPCEFASSDPSATMSPEKSATAT